MSVRGEGAVVDRRARRCRERARQRDGDREPKRPRTRGQCFTTFTKLLAGRTVLVTGANHGIGAATAVALPARLGAHVGLTYLRIDNGPDPGPPHQYGRQRRANADSVVVEIEAIGGRASCNRCRPRRPGCSTPACSTRSEAAVGPVSILVNNASGWRLDTFVAEPPSRFGWASQLVDATTFDAKFLVDVRARHSSSPSSGGAAASPR